MITVQKADGWELYDNDKASVRGKCSGFSRKSRLRFLEFVSSIDRRELPLFVTLTYPSDYPNVAEDWKYHLQQWARNHLLRRFPKASAVWKLEPQERGAPHYHLIVWGVPFLPAEWLAETWYAVVGSGDPRHLAAGTQVQRARTLNGVLAYAGKKYLGKEVTLPPGWEFVGRFWGCYGRKNLPRSRVLVCELSLAGYRRLQRVLRKWMHSKGTKWRTGGKVRIFTQKHVEWLRTCEWAETGSCDAWDRTGAVPVERQPF